jgi:hypothetical protein
MGVINNIHAWRGLISEKVNSRKKIYIQPPDVFKIHLILLSLLL